MIRLPAGPHFVTAAAFATAVAVVLNPVMPTLPDVTVPALPRSAGESRLAAPAAPVPGAVVIPPGVLSTAPAPAVPVLAAPSTPAGLGAVAYPPPAPAVAAPRPGASLSVPALTDGVIASVAQPPSTLPAMRGVTEQLEQQFWLYDGGRQRVARTVQRVSPIIASAPRPAAAAQPGAPTPGQAGDSGEDASAKATAPQSHREAVGTQGGLSEAPRAGSGTRG